MGCADAVNGTIYYLVGVCWCLSLYPRGESPFVSRPGGLHSDAQPLAPHTDIAVLSIIMLSLCDTSASVFGRLFGRYTPPLPLSGTLFGAKKSLAGTAAAVLVGMSASYVFWAQFAAKGDEGDVSWVPARLQSAWRGPVNPDPWGEFGLARLPNPQRYVWSWVEVRAEGAVLTIRLRAHPRSTLDLRTLVVVNGLTAGLAEVRAACISSMSAWSAPPAYRSESSSCTGHRLFRLRRQPQPASSVRSVLLVEHVS